MTALGIRIAELRRVADLTQVDLALKLGTSEAVIYQYESGRREPSLKRLRAIAKALGVTPDRLLCS